MDEMACCVYDRVEFVFEGLLAIGGWSDRRECFADDFPPPALLGFR
jgi:hypothetical protein